MISDVDKIAYYMKKCKTNINQTVIPNVKKYDTKSNIYNYSQFRKLISESNFLNTVTK